MKGYRGLEKAYTRALQSVAQRQRWERWRWRKQNPWHPWASRHNRRPSSCSPADPNWNAEAGRYKNHEEMLAEWHRVNDQISAFIGIEFLAERPPKYG